MATHDVTPEMHERISTAVFGFIDVYATDDGYQVELRGRGERTRRRLELAGFEVTCVDNDWMGDDPYTLIAFREGASN